ncbi:Alpha/Beta hydrolase protein [Phyllosticta citrichinensis]|uniref:Alpha/Beta hydrolase protein n=1 Tax=Phyllosticta citrichinensis TaxID=1130410 RepID=A0ABR1XNW6_9PEZI
MECFTDLAWKPLRHTKLSIHSVVISVVSSTALYLLIKRRATSQSLSFLPSPRTTVLPQLSAAEQEALPYPPDALLGARDVATPYGSLRVYEWGPENGEKVLLLHGISTPSIALIGVATELVQRGRRVMLFDFFGRGYSDAPADLPHDSRLYSTQIFLAIQSSPLSWTGENAFSIVGYSLGGAVAADFASWFTNLVSSLILVAPGGIIRKAHISWKSKLLYNSSSVLPTQLLNLLVSRKLYTPPDSGSVSPKTVSGTISAEDAEAEAGNLIGNQRLVVSTSKCSSSTQTRRGSMESDPTQLVPGRPNATAANAVNWQLRHHSGFITSFVSSILHAPIYECNERWRELGCRLREKKTKTLEVTAERRRPGRDVLFLLGSQDPIIVVDEILQDAEKTLGGENFEATVLEAGHELPISMPGDVVAAMCRFWGDEVDA